MNTENSKELKTTYFIVDQDVKNSPLFFRLLAGSIILLLFAFTFPLLFNVMIPNIDKSFYFVWVFIQLIPCSLMAWYIFPIWMGYIKIKKNVMSFREGINPPLMREKVILNADIRMKYFKKIKELDIENINTKKKYQLNLKPVDDEFIEQIIDHINRYLLNELIEY